MSEQNQSVPGGQMPVPPAPMPTPPYQPPTRPHHRSGPGVTWPLLLITVGVVLLLNTTGIIPWRAWSRLWTLWPIVLVLIGLDLLLSRRSYLLRVLVGLLAVACLVAGGVYLVWTLPPEEVGTSQSSFPLQGVERGRVNIQMGVGRLNLDSLGDTASFAEVRAEGEEWTLPRADFRTEGGVAYLDVRGVERAGPHWNFGWGHETSWNISLAPRVALEVDIDTGVSQSHLDLKQLDVEELTLDSGVGAIDVTLPGNTRDGRVRISGGVGALHVVIPQGVAARIRVDGGLGRVSVDTGRFPRSGNVYRSSDYDTAAYRLDITINGGVGEVTVN